jgi:outer membrane biogenesis lipoprotein LolB
MKSLVIVLLSLTIIATGCSTLERRVEGPPPSASSPEAQALFSRLQSQNNQLLSFKGTGRLRIENTNGIQHARLMWAAHGQDKLRLEIMGTTGQPVFSFANDGERIYLISHTENRFHSRRDSNPNLEKLVSIPITVGACLDLMAGRIPSATHHVPATLQDSKENEQLLTLKGLERKMGSQHVFLDASSQAVRRVEVFDQDENLDFRAEFVRMQHVSGFEVPEELRLSNNSQASLRLVVERFWPNAAVSVDLFKLAKPN